MSQIELRFGDDVVHHIELTDEQARAYLDGRAGDWWTSPNLPDIGIDADGTIIEHEDARRAEVVWSHARVANELLRLAHELDGKYFPPQRVIRTRSRTLLRSVQETGGSRIWAKRLGLVPWPQGRPWPS